MAVSDGAIIFILAFFLYLSAFFNRWFYILIKIFIVIVSLLYVIDIIIIFTFNSRLYFEDIGKFSDYLEPDILSWHYYVWIFLFLYLSILFVLNYKVSHEKLKLKVVSSFLLVVVSISFSVDTTVRGPLFKNFLSVNLSATYKKEYSNIFLSKFNYSVREECKKIEPERPENIIVFIFESWSTYQSKGFGGDKNWTPELDELAKENISFSRFYANGFTTETGLYALLTGDVLLPYKAYYGADGAVGLNAVSYSKSFPQHLKKTGYRTYFVTSGDLNFLQKRDWLESLGFEEIIGNESFKKEDRLFMFDSVSDKKLYEKVREIAGSNESKFIVVENVNTHQPYHYPEKGEVKKSEEFAFRYADKQLANVVRELSSPDTMIVVLSDHRAMTSMTEKESAESGLMAAAHVPMFILWKGQEDVIDTVLQQTDVLPSIADMITGEQCTHFSRGAIFPLKQRVESKCVYYARGDERSKVSVMCEEEQFEVLLDGDNTRVLQDAKPKGESVDYINMLRIKNLD